MLPPRLSPPIHLCLALSLRLAFSPSCYEGHQASGDAVPQEESKLASPSLLLFFHNLLFMSDRPPPDKWLPYGERKAEEKEGRKNSPCILFLPVASWVSLQGVLKFRSVLWRHFASCFNIHRWVSRATQMAARTSKTPAVSSSWWRYQSWLIVKRCTVSVGCKPQPHMIHSSTFLSVFKGRAQIVWDNVVLYCSHSLTSVHWFRLNSLVSLGIQCAFYIVYIWCGGWAVDGCIVQCVAILDQSYCLFFAFLLKSNWNHINSSLLAVKHCVTVIF